MSRRTVENPGGRRDGRRPAPLRRSPLAAAVLALACLAPAPPPAMPGSSQQTPEAALAAAGARLRVALEKALGDGGTPTSLRLFAQCFRGGGPVAVEVFGNGVGIWNGRRQFQASSEEIASAVNAALEAGLPEMDPLYGGQPRGRRAASEHSGAAPVRLVCAVEIEAGDSRRRVEQIAGGEQHPALLNLADRWLSFWRTAGQAGTAAASLDDGLARIAAGTLAPETLRLTLHERPELGTEGRGVLLRLRGRQVVARPFTPSAGYGPPRTWRIGEKELRSLAGRMAELAPARMPVNLFAPTYLDLTLEVLGHRIAIQARRFAGMTATTHGAVQRDFDRLLAVLRSVESERSLTEAGEPPGGP